MIYKRNKVYYLLILTMNDKEKREILEDIHEVINSREEDIKSSRELASLIEERGDYKLSDELRRLVEQSNSDIKLLRSIAKKIRKGSFSEEDEKTLEYIMDNPPVQEFMKRKTNEEDSEA